MKEPGGNGVYRLHTIPHGFYIGGTLSKYFPKIDMISESDLSDYVEEYSTQQGIYESYYRDEMVVFGKWEFDPLDLENIFDDKGGSFHIWQGGMDEGIPIPLVHYVVQKLPWIHYHEVPNATHAIALDNHIKYQMLKELVTYQNGIASSTNNYI
ncbi:hypothetical protein Leryth_008401 [Lithospermum erythrorhizon]|nr:hypothetical protein Leryth_008401 [Lithospermum erythrorhizon]